MKSFKTHLEEKKSGTYIGVRYDESSVRKLLNLTSKIPNGVLKDKLHSTIIYSRVKIDIPLLDNMDWSAIPGKIEYWDTQDGKRAVILNVKCTDMIDRHKYIMETTKATYDYDEYKPHITLSYDVPKDYEMGPSGINELKIISEYKEDLDLDWTDST